MSWEDFIRTRILAKVGMTGSNVSTLRGGRDGGNVATPHARIDGVGPRRSSRSPATTPIRPAASISNAEDMAKWLRVQLAQAGSPTVSGSSPKPPGAS